MGWVFAALIVVVIAFAFLAGLGRLGQFSPQIDDRPVPALPEDRPLIADDLNQLKFAVVTRGYSMEQVDAVLDRCANQLAATTADALETESTIPSAGTLGPVPNGWPSNVLAPTVWPAD